MNDKETSISNSLTGYIYLDGNQKEDLWFNRTCITNNQTIHLDEAIKVINEIIDHSKIDDYNSDIEIINKEE